MNQHLSFLKKLTFFKEFPDKEMVVLIGILKEFRPRMEEVICQEGDRGSSCYIVVSGSIKVSTNKGGCEQVLTTLRRGEMFGQVSLIDGSKRSATCVASWGTLLLEMQRSDFEQLYSSYSSFTFRFLSQVTKNLAKNLRNADQRLSTLVDSSSKDIKSITEAEPVHWIRSPEEIAVIAQDINRSIVTPVDPFKALGPYDKY